MKGEGGGEVAGVCHSVEREGGLVVVGRCLCCLCCR